MLKNSTMKRYLIYLLFIILIIIFATCAKQVTLTGGDQDITPPEITLLEPESRTLNFAAKNILFKFNEYVKLNNAQQNLIVSPPLTTNPTVRLNGKYVKILLDGVEFKDSTTYTINLSNIIGDNNENNLITSFIYSFSTGDKLDSLCISGILVNELASEEQEGVTVLLHSDFSDSAFLKNTPDYITKTEKGGKFFIPNIAKKNYKIFALKDINNNHKFDLPTEGIAFLDSIITPTVIETSKMQYDTVAKDSIEIKTLIFKPDNIKLLFFTENKQPQFIKSYKRLFYNHFEIKFNSTQYEKFEIKFKNIPDSSLIIHKKNNPDTISVWIKDSIFSKKDTIIAYLKYTDPIFLDTIHYDTLKLSKIDATFNDSIESITITQDINNFNKFIISSKYPIKEFFKEKISLMSDDSINYKYVFSIEKDSINPHKLILITEIAEEIKLLFSIDSAFIFDIYSLTNNRTEAKITSLANKAFGELIVKLPENKDYIVELLQSDIVKYSIATKNNEITIKKIKPGKYKIKVIDDKNANKRWDTGNYSKKLQAEPIKTYQEEYEIKENFTHEVIFQE